MTAPKPAAGGGSGLPERLAADHNYLVDPNGPVVGCTFAPMNAEVYEHVSLCAEIARRWNALPALAEDNTRLWAALRYALSVIDGAIGLDIAPAPDLRRLEEARAALERKP